MTLANANRMIQALRDFGFASLNLQDEDFIVPDQVIQLGYPPSRLRLK